VTQAEGPTQLPVLLDVEGVAGHLKISVRHVRRLVLERRIPFLKVGSLVRFDPAELADWLAALQSGRSLDAAASSLGIARDQLGTARSPRRSRGRTGTSRLRNVTAGDTRPGYLGGDDAA
jgi:excisionase family DNA binding protein